MTHLPPVVRPPSRDELVDIAESYYFDLSEDEVDDFMELIEAKMGFCSRIDELSDRTGSQREARRDPGYRATSDEDPLNAIVTYCDVETDANGPLSGYEVGIKDNISVAGVEMTCASKVMAGHHPKYDAPVVDRLLEAGAQITAKTNMDEMAVSGSGEMSAFGPILNPFDDDYLAGGSSGGSAVAVVTGQVDVAIGTDQAGSLRTPAAWSGCVGFKPTHGLVPFRGAAPLGHSFDHIGPMATSVEDATRVLDVIAGKDPRDPRQGVVETGDYLEALETDIEGCRIGVVSEGFGFDGGEEGVNDGVRAAVDQLEELGAEAEEVSIPWHVDGFFVWLAVENEEAAAVWDADGTGYFVDGHYDTDLAEAFGKSRRSQADEFAPTVKLKCILGKYLKDKYYGRYHGKAQNLREDLTAAYDEEFSEFDVLAMPTTPMTAFELEEDLTRIEAVNRAQGKKGRTRNTMPFDMTGHPAISVPCGKSDGLPIGLMLVGRHFEEETVISVADAFERNTDWEDRHY
ncbi:amidase [Natrarchaeobius chitinivorans]|uniref:Asp-tRNA(Asn)/Glu-tRNA(Gln) amidotransferase subunit GatA n=1 Tax=Natrarchaeobius chitinivorans TaxID=1679083 RepID=A0A3N6ME35_NATCH|nr:amidase [Natrarchaeobius chitinivorans]RQG94890.1 Asp-tRNA(Asn)/Glu-tRNA(Gln) amidotransferase subunit GatA [Natrarchaeobius chitinivorans]